MTSVFLIVSEVNLDDNLLKQGGNALRFIKLFVPNSKFYCEDKMAYLDLHIYECLTDWDDLVRDIMLEDKGYYASYKSTINDRGIKFFWSLEECRQHKRQKIYFMHYLPLRCERLIDRAKEAVKLLNNPNAQMPLLDLHKYSEVVGTKLYQINYR